MGSGTERQRINEERSQQTRAKALAAIGQRGGADDMWGIDEPEPRENSVTEKDGKASRPAGLGWMPQEQNGQRELMSHRKRVGKM